MPSLLTLSRRAGEGIYGVALERRLCNGLALFLEGFAAGVESFDDTVGVEDAASPDTAGCRLEGGPEAGVVGELGMRFEGFGGWSGIEFLGAPFWTVVGVAFPNEVDGARLIVAVDDDFDEVAFSDASDWTACEGLGADVSDAGTGGDAGEPGVGDERDVFAV